MAAHAHVYRALRKHMFQAGSSDEIREAKSGDRTAAMWSVNGPPGLGAEGDIDAKLEALETWYHLGVRLMHLSYNRRNMVADGCTEPANGGLSEFGREFVRKMNEVGLIVDTPHSGKQTTLDAAAVSEKPVMASHVGVEGVFPGHPRCKSDEELKAIAGTGGLIGIYAVPSLLGPDADVALMLDHLDYAAKLIGVEHVSIGTDICYMRLWPEDLKPYPKKPEDYLRAGGWKKEHMQYASNAHLDGSLAWTNWPLYTVGLVMRGYADEDIRKILGENLMRVLDANRPAHEGAL
jgi:membrane dipeptidase